MSMGEKILTAAMSMAIDTGYQALSRSQIARKADVSDALISFHFGNMKGLHDSMMMYAIKSENLIVLAQGIANGHRIARGAPDKLKRKAALFVAKES